jgi:hypothetical protein
VPDDEQPRLTRDIMRRLGLTAEEAISRFKRASIRRQFPAEFLTKRLDEIEKAHAEGDRHATTALKLLFRREFDK